MLKRIRQQNLKNKLEKNILNKQQQQISVHMIGGKYLRVEIVHKKGIDLIHEPLYYKGMAHSISERDRLDIRGLIPPIVKTIEEQEDLIMQEYRTGHSEKIANDPKENILERGINVEDIRKWKVLNALQDRNETLFYRIIKDNFQEMNRIIYTPTVGWACQNFSQIYRRPRGMFFSAQDKGQMASMIYNWPHNEVDAIVLTDGSRVLGLGDLGVGGLGISIGKLDLYVAGGGFHPRKVLPIVLDVGTNNQELIKNPNYIGLRQNRIDGEEYYQILDELIAACFLRWPNVLIQFEDFQLKHAIKSLRRYRNDYLVFNDDIQGTAATVLAGIFGALAIKGCAPKEIVNQKIMVCGAGSAGGGAIITICKSMRDTFGLSQQQAGQNFWIHDHNGLITLSRKSLSEQENNFSELRLFARNELQYEGEQLLESIKRVKPHILIGLSGVGGLFTDEIIQEMNNQKDPPIIFALSNPTSKSECTAEQAVINTDGRVIFSSGSPFDDVHYKGKIYKTSQCNNKYIFPGLALGASLGQTGTISDSMIMCASESLSELIHSDDIEMRKCFPEVTDIREISCFLASKVILQAYKEGKTIVNKNTLVALQKGFKELQNYVRSRMWDPEYRPIVYLNHGQK